MPINEKDIVWDDDQPAAAAPAFNEAQIKWDAGPAIPEAPPAEGSSLGGMMKGVGEVGLSMATAIPLEVLSGIAGLTQLAVERNPEAAAKTVEEIQGWAYQPKSEEAGKILRPLAETIGKVMAPIEKGIGAAAEKAGEVAGPTAAGLVGAGLKTAGGAAVEAAGAMGPAAAARALKKAPGAAVRGVKQIPGRAQKLLGFDPAESPAIAATVQEVDDQAVKVSNLAASRLKGTQTKVERLAGQVAPDPQILAAAEEFGVQNALLPSHTSTNPVYTAIEQGLKSRPGSLLAARERELIGNLANKADDLIREFGGTTDKSDLSVRFESDSNQVITDLAKAAELEYAKVKEAIPRDMPIQSDNVMRVIQEEIAEQGGLQFIDPVQRRLFKALDPESNPTYARLDSQRKAIGKALGRESQKSPYQTLDEGLLKRMYGALAEDQLAAARSVSPEAEELYKQASTLVATRKTMEDQVKVVLGKQLTGTVAKTAKSAVLGLQNGDIKGFDRLIANIPEQLGPDMRREVIASALNDAMVQGSRKQRQLNIAGFDDFMTGVKRNNQSVNRLRAELSENSWQRLNTFHKVVGAIRRAQEDAITTGRSALVPGIMDEDGLLDRAYSMGQTAAAEGAAAAAGAPGAGIVLRSLLGGKAAKKSAKADALLADPKMLQAIQAQVVNDLETVRKAEEALRRKGTFRGWFGTLSPEAQKQVTRGGVTAYLFSGPTEREE